MKIVAPEGSTNRVQVSCVLHVGLLQLTQSRETWHCIIGLGLAKIDLGRDKTLATKICQKDMTNSMGSCIDAKYKRIDCLLS